MPTSFSFNFGHRFLPVLNWSAAFLVFTEDNVFTPDPGSIAIANRPDGMTITADRFAWAGLQRLSPGAFTATIRYVEGGFDCAIHASLPGRIKGTALLLRHERPTQIPTRDFAQTPCPPKGADLVYPGMRLPVWPLQRADGTFTAIASLDDKVRRKVVSIVTDPDSTSVTLELHHHEDARHWSTTQTTPVWRVVHTSDPAPLFESRLQIAHKAWGLTPWETRTDVPSWARRTGVILNLHGTHWTGYVFNTYAQQLEAIRYVAQRIGGQRVLALLAAWDGRYNYNWPGYQPDEAMGGEAGLRALVDGAHALGARVIPQIGAQSANRRFLPPALHDCGIRDAFGNPYVKEVDWDNDRAGDTYRVNANIGHPGFRTFLLDHTARLRDTFGFDGIFLDINMAFHNDPNFNILEGHRAFAHACHAQWKDFLIFGENWYDGLMPLYPLVHSVNDKGAGLMQRWPHVFNRYCRATYHLIHPAPGHPGQGSTGVYEAGYVDPFDPDPDSDAIPAISFVNDTLRNWAPHVDRRIEGARRFIARTGI
jgi:hypothetical protein